MFSTDTAGERPEAFCLPCSQLLCFSCDNCMRSARLCLLLCQGRSDRWTLADCNDNLEGLEKMELDNLHDWQAKFYSKYPIVGDVTA